MKTMHKFKLDSNKDVTVVKMPAGAVVLHVHEQDNEPCLWAVVNDERRKVARKFRVIGSGREIDKRKSDTSKLPYVGTVHLDGGRVVAHVFEELS